MEHLIKKTSRVKFAGQQSTQAPGSSKNQFSQEEKERPQNWFRRQISWQMNQDYDSNGVERATAVAAAAYVIASLKESSTPEQKRIRDSTEPSLTQIKSRKQDQITGSRPERGEYSTIQESKVLETADTEEKPQGKVVGPASSMKKTPTFTDKPAASMKKTPTFTDEPAASMKKTPTFTDKPAASMKKTPTFTDKPAFPMKKIPTFAEKQFSRDDDMQPEILKQKTDQPVTKPEILKQKTDQPVTKPEIEAPKPDRRMTRLTSVRPGIGGTEADAWERTQLDKIKEKYAAMESRILSWENKKKTKSRRRLDKSEGELERKRFKALEKFRSEVEDANQIAEGARAKARKEQQNEELKTKEKANKFRKTGKAPTTCFCF